LALFPKLQLPASSSIYDVFHFSQLKKAAPWSRQVPPSIPDLYVDKQIPKEILSKKLVARGDDSVERDLIK
jgi:hypothetical protein